MPNEEKFPSASESHSLWMDLELPSFPPLKENIEADVCIVGAGIAGLTCAYTLSKQGKSVVILEMGQISGGQTARTTAHISWALDDRYSDLEKLFGEQGAKLAAESHMAALNYIESIIKEEKIECDFNRLDGYLFKPPEDSMEILNNEYEAIKKIGMEIKRVENAPFGSSFDTGSCLCFPQQGEFHPLKYIDGLIKAIVKNGGKIYGETQAVSFEDGEPCKVATQSGNIVTCQSIIVATCTPVNNRLLIHTKQAAYRTYVIAAAIPAGSIPKALFWDTIDPYHYIRTQRNEKDSSKEWLIVGGEDHKTGQGKYLETKFNHLEDWARQRFPQMLDVEYRWSGQVFEPIDSLAFIGLNPLDKHIYIVTGDSGNGITHGTIAGILIPDLILGKQNSWENLYSPTRKNFSAALDFVEENANTALQYSDWLAPNESENIDNLSLDEGMIVRDGLKKAAVYKDKEGNIHQLSAFCPHLAGCVRWNNVEKSWDCPCHGSRFDCYGKLLIGPANGDLSPLEEKIELKEHASNK